MDTFRSLLMITFALFWTSTECRRKNDNNGYILWSPSVFDTNSSETLCLTLHGIESEGNIVVFLTTTNNSVASTKTSIKTDLSQCFQLKVPHSSDSEATLQIDGSFPNYHFRNRTKVKLQRTPDIIIIQTDKRVYNPGQKVKFRAFHVNRDLKPSKNVIRSISLLDPNDNIIKDWKSPKSEKGLIEKSFRLSANSKLGKWTISVNDQNSSVTRETFRVDKNAGLKFDVIITPPAAVLSNAKEFGWKVCAYYQDGRPVSGQIEASITRTSKQRSNLQNQKTPPKIIQKNEFRECQIINMQNSGLKFQDKTFGQYSTVTFYAEVTERETGTKISNFWQAKVNELNVEFLSKQYFKPGLPYEGMILITDSSGRPVENVRFELTSRAYAVTSRAYADQNNKPETLELMTLKTDRMGIARFDISENTNNFQSIIYKLHFTLYPIYIKYYNSRISTPITDQDDYEETILRWHSPSNSYIQIDRPSHGVACYEPFNITGDYILSDDDDSDYIIVYYQLLTRNKIRNQESTVIQKQIKNKNTKKTRFTIKISIDEILPPMFEVLVYFIRKTGEVVSDSEVFAAEECFKNQVDINFKSNTISPGDTATLQLAAESNSLCATVITDQLQSSGQQYISNKIFSILQDKQHVQSTTTLNNAKRKCQQFGSQDSFSGFGMIAMTDLIIDFNPCQANNLGGFGSNGVSEALTFEDSDEIDESNENSDKESFPDTELNSNFPKTSLWDLSCTGGNGEQSVSIKVPNATAQWSAYAICISSEVGLGVSPEISLTTRRILLSTLEMPPFVKIDEKIAVKVTIASYHKECLPIEIIVANSTSFEIIDNMQSEQCICKERPYSYAIHIRPLKVGNINVEVDARSKPSNNLKTCNRNKQVPELKSSATKLLTVMAEGITKEETQSDWLCANDQRKIKIYSLATKKTAITGSEIKFVSVAGDYIAPTMKGLENLVRLPTGCGEQNMVHFAPMVYTLQYLNTTGQLTDSRKQSITLQMKQGYENQLNYKRYDDSFSIWGNKDKEGSTWLTAFVIKSFAQAKSMIIIDENVIKGGLSYITKNQLNNGCFKSTGKLYDKNIQGKIRAGSQQTHTLYITIALLEAGYQQSQKIITKAFQCTDATNNLSTHQLAMKAYANALAGQQNKAEEILKLLENDAIVEDDLTYWKNDELASIEFNIETTSYVLLAMTTLRNYNFRKIISVARWLIARRNANGGLVSTQDTVLAIQALAKCTSKQQPQNMNVETIIQSKRFHKVVYINSTNRMAMQTIKIPSSWNSVAVAVKGKGCALVQVTEKYNIPSIISSPSFSIEYSITTFNRRTTQKKQIMRICASYLGSDERSSQTIIEIQMVTGYQADESQLKKLIHQLNNLSNYNIEDDGSVVLYFDYLTQICFDIDLNEISEAENRKAATIKVYDYYQPDLMASTKYSFKY